ncbi:hypothetical protein OX459_25645 [Janthinobacterium sp. SUN026]|uniref:hypothetical protein n=1 Tax=Janthinobacterium sp. SUN026 TaxID=3002438 RepID=UPI0025B0CD11|nr:hypothetical protein [Janthinobacterium sp. SUN026]MDN2674786.1 hypothetical protein [Janthinobacterium sp. SUN026]
MTKILDALNKSKEFLKKILPHSFAIKLLASALVAVLGGGFLGILSDYATYSYAISVGVRAPLEGTPYLKATVAFGSIFLLITSALVFSFMIYLTQSVYQQALLSSDISAFIIKILKLNPAQRDSFLIMPITELQKLKLEQKYIILGSITVISFLMAFGIALIPEKFEPLNFNFPYSFSITPTPFILALSISAFVIIISGIIIMPLVRKALSILSATIYFFWCVTILFNPTYYAQFVRMIGYGGGLPIEIHAKDDNLQKKINGRNVGLIIKTTETVLVFDSEKNTFMEIPNSEISYISYQAGGLNKLKTILPAN